MTICHVLLQYTTHILSYQSKSNELREAREVFFQWLSGHSQAGKCLVDLYRHRYPLRCWLVIRESIPYSLFIRLPVSKTLDAIGRTINWISMEALSGFTIALRSLWEFYRLRQSLS